MPQPVAQGVSNAWIHSVFSGTFSTRTGSVRFSQTTGQATQEMQFWFVQAQADCERGSLLVALMLQAGITDCHSPASFSDPDPRLGLS